MFNVGRLLVFNKFENGDDLCSFMCAKVLAYIVIYSVLGLHSYPDMES